MIEIICVQGSDEWLSARTGVITASKYRDAIETIKGKKEDGYAPVPSSKSRLYAAQVALERISKKPCDEMFNSWQMKRGQEMEQFARIEYEAATGNMATESGVVLTDDRLFGYSTDGFVDDDGIIEIKSLASAIGVLEMWRDGDMSEYMHQMQGGMWIAGRKWCDFVMYAPQLESIGKQLYRRRVMRDDNFIDEMVGQLMKFSDQVLTNEAILRMK